MFGVSVASMVKWSQRLHATGSAGAQPMGGHRKRILAGEQAWMLARLVDQPDLTVRSLTVELGARGFVVSHNTVWSLLRAAGFRKKPVRRGAGSAVGRATMPAMEEVSGAS